jgi:acyl-ACP thioesterase
MGERTDLTPHLLRFSNYRADDEQLIASGTSQWNILNLDTKRLETTEFLADKLTVLPKLMTGSHKKVRFPKPQSFDMQMEHRATRLDLDFNFHVSNRSYISIALLTMPDEILASQTLTSLVVHWLHETYLDDTLTCRMSCIDDGNYLHTLTNAEGVVVSELLSRWQPQPETTDVSEVLNRDL